MWRRESLAKVVLLKYCFPAQPFKQCTITLSIDPFLHQSHLLQVSVALQSTWSWIQQILDPRSQSSNPRSSIPIQKIQDPPSWPTELTLEPGQGWFPGATAERGDHAAERDQEEDRLQDQLLTLSIHILTCNQLTREAQIFGRDEPPEKKKSGQIHILISNNMQLHAQAGYKHLHWDGKVHI